MLIEALTGRFDDHHAELARILLDQIDTLSNQIATLTTRIEQQLADMSPTHAHADDAGPTGTAGPVANEVTGLAAAERLDENRGIGAPRCPGHHRRGT